MPDMARSYDRYAEGKPPHPPDDIVIIVADEVAAWARDGDYLQKPVEEFPCLAPRFPVMWIEYPSWSGKERRGILVIDSTEVIPDMVGDTKTNESLLAVHQGAIDDARKNGYEGELRWTLTAFPNVDDGKKVHGPLGGMMFVLDPSGRVQGNRWIWFDTKTAKTLEDKIGEGVDHWLLAATMPALFTLSLMHCKNMTTETITPPPKVSKKWQRHHGRPLTRYQVLKLELPGKPSSSSWQNSGRGGGFSTAVHMVGGHFSHYGDCCPGAHDPHGKLFGRLEGIYWMPLHLRGRAELGTIKTDYVATVDAEAARRSLSADL